MFGGYKSLRLGVRFLTFWGRLNFLRFGVTNPYVRGLNFFHLEVINPYIWVLDFLRLRFQIFTFGG